MSVLLSTAARRDTRLPPLPPSGFGPPVTISSGGVYRGLACKSDSVGTPAITISTTQLVVIEDSWAMNTAGGYVIDAGTATGRQVVVRNVFAYGSSNISSTGRWFRSENFLSVALENCTVHDTQGIELDTPTTGASVLISKIKHINTRGGASPAADPVGNFVQFRICRTALIVVEWCEVVNEYNQSCSEDLVSIYHTRDITVRDCYFQHQSNLNNAGSSSQGGITIDASDTGAGCQNVDILRNQVVDGYGIFAALAVAGGDDIRILENRIVADNFLPNGDTKANGFRGLRITTNGTNCEASDNVVGYYGTTGRYDFDATSLEGDYRGGTTAAAANTHWPADPTAADERAEWDIWQAKLAANGVAIGAGAR